MASRTIMRDDTDGKGIMGNPAKVCYPEVNGSGVVPPCISISNIESACQPNGTEPVDFNAHAQCMHSHGCLFGHFSSVQTNARDAPFVTTGDTVSSDKFPSKTDVSLYYTATGPQGPGAITGAAATATRVSHPSATNLTASNTSGNNKKNTPSRTGSGPASENASITRPSSSTSTGGAPAQGTGMAMAIAGAALVLAL
ncbi:hypothetical protein J3459_006424 [Metarhizium acridum]|nr:hypothetical protein J3459_006424 [Metarhizium acridum]